MTKMFASALALTLATTGAWAQETTKMMDYSTNAMAESQADLIRTRDITGGTIYTMNEANDEGWNMDFVHNGLGDNWNDIGEIEDIVLNKSGQMVGIVAEIGGFLDIGDKHVVLSVEDVNLVAVDDETYAFVTRMSEEQLEELREVDEGWWN
ncbi:PRC-barrel domain-containing protein [Marivita sp. S6314]|uniref:PRC-barrel domain-containing protein n=1 Tax=Marivita sp. S6314 TaxID=2926406 RepID=UPI001FF60C76|nr:PRC-barrel domain-containing protein [Marivita sp. S6314]MCK0150439.1 PRC-barrel domain-containing protein [Marivita sp. S6314]